MLKAQITRLKCFYSIILISKDSKNQMQPLLAVGALTMLLLTMGAGCASGPRQRPVREPQAVVIEVEESLADEEDLAGAEIVVTFEDGVLVLTGTAPSLEVVRTALRLGGRVAGVEQVVNRVRVGLAATGGEADDGCPGFC